MSIQHSTYTLMSTLLSMSQIDCMPKVCIHLNRYIQIAYMSIIPNRSSGSYEIGRYISCLKYVYIQVVICESL